MSLGEICLVALAVAVALTTLGVVKHHRRWRSVVDTRHAIDGGAFRSAVVVRLVSRTRVPLVVIGAAVLLNHGPIVVEWLQLIDVEGAARQSPDVAYNPLAHALREMACISAPFAWWTARLAWRLLARDSRCLNGIRVLAMLSAVLGALLTVMGIASSANILSLTPEGMRSRHIPLMEGVVLVAIATVLGLAARTVAKPPPPT